jgi:hypothetical protein
MNITTHESKEQLTYFGPELRPHFILSKFNIEDSALVVFRGPCEVKTDHLVDWEDRLANDFIRAKEMVHFLGEFFGITLKEGIWIQRLIVSEIGNELLRLKLNVLREGDDLFIDEKKLSVSIVTVSPVSVLLHLGLNIDSTGAPVKATGLQDYLSKTQIDTLISSVLSRFQTEYQSVHRASVKVRPVL